jgi:hypothetical protein
MEKLKIAVAAFAIVASISVMAGSASAMPVDGQLPAATGADATLQHVRWLCGPYRCWWSPGPYWPGAPRWGWGGWHRPWGGGWGWGGGWHRWSGGWGWHRHWR